MNIFYIVIEVPVTVITSTVLLLHHFNTVILNVQLYELCYIASYVTREGDLRVIRPFVFVRERDLKAFAQQVTAFFYLLRFFLTIGGGLSGHILSTTIAVIFVFSHTIVTSATVVYDSFFTSSSTQTNMYVTKCTDTVLIQMYKKLMLKLYTKLWSIFVNLCNHLTLHYLYRIFLYYFAETPPSHI